MGVSERPDIDVHSLPTIPFRNKQETVTAVGLNFVQYNNPKPVFLRSDFFVSFLMSLFLRRKFVRWHLFVSFLLLIFDFIGMVCTVLTSDLEVLYQFSISMSWNYLPLLTTTRGVATVIRNASAGVVDSGSYEYNIPHSMPLVLSR